MIKTLKPYGSIKNSLVYKVWEFKDKFYMLDIYGSTFQIDEKTYKEIKEDD